jgi:TolB protein
MIPPAPQREWHAYALLAGLSILIRVPLLISGTFDLVSFDGTYYINQARALWSNAPQPGSFPIGYPFLISLLLPIVGDGVRAAQAVSFLASLGALFVLYALGRRYLSRRLAFYSAVAMAVTPLFVRLSLESFSEMAYTCWLLLALWMYARGRDAAAGVAGGMAAMTRPEMLGVAGLLFALRLRLRPPRRAALFALPFIVIFSFNALKFYQSTGQFSLLPKSEFFGTGAQAWFYREQTVDEITSGGGAAVTKQQGEEENIPTAGAIAANYFKKLPAETLLLARNVGFLALFLAVFGLARRPTFLLAALIPFFVGPLFTVRSADRYLLPYVPLIFLYAFVGVESLKSASHRKYAYGALGASLLLMIVLNFGQFTRPVDEGLTEVKEAGMFLRDSVREGDILADRKPYVAFYAGAKYMEIPLDSYHGTMQYLLDNDVRFLSLHARVLKKMRPLMMTLLTDRAVIAGELRWEQVWGHDEGLLIYERALDRDPATWRRLNNPGRGFDSSPAWSPDGNLIAFSSRLGQQLDIFVVPSEGGERKLIVESPRHDDQPDWSPDGKRLAFSSNRTGDWNIYITNVETGEGRLITHDTANDASPSWTPDGTAIVFMSERTGAQELWKIDLRNGELTQLTTGGSNSFPAVSPDGSRVAWTNVNRGMMIMDLATRETIVVPVPKETNYAPTWSPDGRYLAVTGRDWGSVDIYIVTSGGERGLLLTKNAMPGPDVMFDALPSWSPDGERLALISNKDGPQALYVITGLKPYTERFYEKLQIITYELGD